MKWHLAGVFGMILLETSHGTESLPPLKETPKNIEEVWSGYDPALEPIAARVVREWEEGGCTLRYILYSIGHFKGKPAIMAGFYGFPSGQKDFPAVMHMHGGGNEPFFRSSSGMRNEATQPCPSTGEAASWKAPKQKIPTPTGEPSTQRKTMSLGIPTSYPTRRVSIPFPRHKTTTGSC